MLSETLLGTLLGNLTRKDAFYAGKGKHRSGKGKSIGIHTAGEGIVGAGEVNVDF